MKYVLGIDLSLTGTGIVLLKTDGEKYDVHIQDVIKTKPTDSAVAELTRLQSIRNKIPYFFLSDMTANLSAARRADLAVIEGIAFMAHQTTALAQLAGLNYLVRDKLQQLGIPFIIVAPTTLKKYVTGKVNTQKNEIMLAAYKKWGVTLTNDNLCDAYGLARIGCELLNHTEKLTKPELEVLALLEKQYHG